MKIINEDDNVRFYESINVFWDTIKEGPYSMESRSFPAGTTIAIEYWGEEKEMEDSGQVILELDQPATISCRGFATSNLTSDHWLVIKEESEKKEVWVIFNEPQDYAKSNKELIFRVS